MYAFLVTCKNPLTIARDSRLSTGPSDGPLHLSPTEAALVLLVAYVTAPKSTVAATPFLRQGLGGDRGMETRILWSPGFWGQPQL